MTIDETDIYEAVEDSDTGFFNTERPLRLTKIVPQAIRTHKILSKVQIGRERSVTIKP